MGKNEKTYTKVEDLREFVKFSEEEEEKMRQILERYPMSITSHYLSLIDWKDPEDPIRRMCIPSLTETDLSGEFDTSGESDNTVITGMQHKYRETALILSTNRCAMYCRHCFRKRLVGLSDEEIARNFDAMMEYIREHQEISNVLVSGGDSLMLSNEMIGRYLEALTIVKNQTVLLKGVNDDPEILGRLLKDLTAAGVVWI